MMRVVLLAVLCGALSLLQPAEVRMNIQQLRAFVSSSRKLGHSDKQIADYLKNIKLTERLESGKEMPLKAIVRGYSFTVTPISWRNRRFGVAKLKIKEMGSRYFFICAYVWLEKYFSRGDYRRKSEP